MTNFFHAAISLLLAGSFLFAPVSRTGKVREGVCVNGQNVGGMSYAEAENSVRAGLFRTPFTVHTPAGDFTPDLTYTDDLAKLLRKAKKGAELTVQYTRTWATAEEDILEYCRRSACDPTDARAFFDGVQFTYTPERSGTICDYRMSLETALEAFEAGETETALCTRESEPSVSLSEMKARTRKLGAYTTYFDGTNTPRRHNIALAAQKINGTILNPGEEFSFNAVVGKRTRENGFEEAAIILDGEFVPGVGGGVCQASTTLMNAALHAGLAVTESRNHSLSVGYVSPSLDAMVSDSSDLKFKNPYPYPVYLGTATGENYVRFTVYGKPDGKRYETESRVRFYLPPPPAEIVEGDTEEVIREAKEGLASESYLLVYDKNGALLSRTLLRRDTYAARKGIYQIKKVDAEGAEGEKEEKNSENPREIS
jgi:vancomycin resistance protein YoaR